jgi:pyrroline-5-carboxylate reductase
MGEALLGGLLGAGWADVTEVQVVEPDPSRAAYLRTTFPGLTVDAQPLPAAGVILATKPAVVPDAAAAVAGDTDRVLSIAAGVATATIEAALGDETPVIRAMPNTPSLVGAGATAIAGGAHAGDDDLDWADGLLSTLGIVVRLDEARLDAVTGLSGSGPAYLFLVAEALIDAGVLVGLDRPTAEALATQTLLGSARLLAETGEPAAALRAAVTSPGGTTAAGLRVLEDRGVRAALLEAVTAATDRSRELGRA